MKEILFFLVGLVTIMPGVSAVTDDIALSVKDIIADWGWGADFSSANGYTDNFRFYIKPTSYE